MIKHLHCRFPHWIVELFLLKTAGEPTEGQIAAVFVCRTFQGSEHHSQAGEGRNELWTLGLYFLSRPHTHNKSGESLIAALDLSQWGNITWSGSACPVGPLRWILLLCCCVAKHWHDLNAFQRWLASSVYNWVTILPMDNTHTESHWCWHTPALLSERNNNIQTSRTNKIKKAGYPKQASVWTCINSTKGKSLI